MSNHGSSSKEVRDAIGSIVKAGWCVANDEFERNSTTKNSEADQLGIRKLA
ncbi:MAG TPA: hypothetical protein VGP72_02585 [Planctomycetota bacterium]|jgi:hypothetical protein